MNDKVMSENEKAIQAIEFALKQDPMVVYGYEFYAVIKEPLLTALSALRQQENMGAQPDMGDPITENKPLTLDELRQMDGEPVWIAEYPKWGHWELSEDATDYIQDREEAYYGMMHNDPVGRYGLHAMGWLAYRAKPEEDVCGL